MRDFQLLESLRWTEDEHYYLLDRHLARLAASAAHFGFSHDDARVRAALEGCASTLTVGSKVRLLLARDGSLRTQATDLGPNTTVQLGLARIQVASDDPFVRHKTTRRDVYERALSTVPSAQDVLLCNERGELTESTRANLVLDTDDGLLTPPVESGLLAGTLRAQLLQEGRLQTAVLRPHDLQRARRICLINSVRGWLDVRFAPEASAG